MKTALPQLFMAQKKRDEATRAAVNLKPREQMLWELLNPWVEKLAQDGWDKRRVTDAVIDHFAQTGEAVMPEQFARLLSPPTGLLLESMERRGKPNAPSGRQQLVLKRLVPNASNRQKTVQILSKICVLEMLGALPFKQLVEEIREHDFVAPQVAVGPAGKTYQGRTLIWPGPA